MSKDYVTQEIHYGKFLDNLSAPVSLLLLLFTSGSSWDPLFLHVIPSIQEISFLIDVLPEDKGFFLSTYYLSFKIAVATHLLNRQQILG